MEPLLLGCSDEKLKFTERDKRNLLAFQTGGETAKGERALAAFRESAGFRRGGCEFQILGDDGDQTHSHRVNHVVQAVIDRLAAEGGSGKAVDHKAVLCQAKPFQRHAGFGPVAQADGIRCGDEQRALSRPGSR